MLDRLTDSWPVESRNNLRFLFPSLFIISFEEGDPKLISGRNIIPVQNVGCEKIADEMFSPRVPKASPVRARVQKEISTTPSEMPDLLSDIRAFLETQNYSIATLKTPTIPENAPSPQSRQPSQERNNGLQPISIAIAYVQTDERHKNCIERDLRTLVKQKWNIKWNAYDINTPSEWVTDVDDPLNACHLLLLLVSPDFVSSEFCYDPSVSQAVKRHMSSFWVSPVLLRPCLWEDTPFGPVQVGGKGLPVLPMNQLSVAEWPSEDAAFLDIARGIKRALEYLKGRI